jgi:hypothetical protein
MNNIYRLIILLLLISFSACTSNPSNMSAGNDEDEDIGLGGTGLLATADGDSDNGLGGTGILGEITGFGSVFVNGIEIEYDRETTFTIDGKPADYQQLQIGDVVEVLTSDLDKHTQAKIINLRHEVIGKVEATDAQTFSFTVQGQTIIKPIHNRLLPEVGTMVAVSGFRIDNKTIISTRVVPTDAKETLLRTHTGLPFENKTTHWLVQLHVKNNKVAFQLSGTEHALKVKQKTKKTYADLLGIKILQLKKPAAGRLKLERVVEPMMMPRGQRVSIPLQQRGGNGYKSGTGSMSGPGTGHGSGAGAGSSTGSGSGINTGSGQSSQTGKGMQR